MKAKSLILMILCTTIACATTQAGGWRDRIRPIDLVAEYPGPCPQPDQFIQVFRDEFNQDSLDRWFWNPDLLGFQHVPGAGATDEFMTPDRLRFHSANNGTLRIETTADPILARGMGWGEDTMTFTDGGTNLRLWPHQSGAITARWPFSQGRYLLRCQVPPGKDMWPAFWLFGDCGDEIDIFEFQNRDTDFRHDRKISLSVHSELNCSPPQGVDTESYNWNENMTTSLHTYGITWDDFQIIFHVDGQVRRRFYHYYRRVTVIPGIAYSYQGVPNCEAIVSGRTYYEDPQFANAMEKVIINSSVRKTTDHAQFPKKMDLDYFALYETIDCQETKVIHTAADIEGFNYRSSYGDRTVTAGNITIQPTNTLFVEGPPPAEWWWPGDLLVLTASNEIRLLPGFEAHHNSNFVAQIRPCGTANKQMDESEALSPPTEPELHFILKGEEVPEEMIHRYQATAGFSLYPNPSNGKVTITGTHPGDQLKVQNLMGKTLHETTSPTDANTEINLPNLNPGIYFVTIQREGIQIAVLRLIHEK